jgi:HSP20 family molecular chaperone IbpA
MRKNRKKDLACGNNDLFAGMFAPSRFHETFSDMCTLMDRAWRDWDLTGEAFYALQPSKSSFPKINVSETDEAYEVSIAVSGFSKNDMELEFKDSCLLIKLDEGSKTNNDSEEDASPRRWLTREISSRSFRRTISFPVKIDGSGIKSSFDDDKSLVTCILPKALKTEPETIRIKID